jgi:HK97 family phage major capsid protein
MAKKTLQEQIKDLENTRAAKLARVNDITQKSIDEERSMDEAEGTESDELTADIEQIDKDLVRLRKLESLNVSVAKRVTVPSDDEDPEEHATRQRSPRIVMTEKKLAQGVAFARYVGCMALAKGHSGEALRYARQRFPEHKALHGMIDLTGRMSGEMIAKAAVEIGATNDTDFAQPLVNYKDIVDDFIAFLRPKTVIGRIPGLRMTPFNIRIPRQTTGGTVGWVGEGKPKPVTKFSFDNITLRFTKLAAISVITEELARFSAPSAETIIRDQLAAAIIQQMDVDFLDPNNAGVVDVKPASITNGITPLSSAGNSEANARTDLGNLFNQWVTNNQDVSNGVILMPSSTAMRLGVMVNALGQASFPGMSPTGGTLLGVPVVAAESGGLTDMSAQGHIVVMVNASEIMLADDGTVTIDASREASLQMDTAPDNPPTASTVMISLWQSNSIGIKAERFINWVRARTSAVSYIASVNWGE